MPGFAKKLEFVAGKSEIDFDKVKFLQAVMALVFMAEKCYFDNEHAEVFLLFREVLRMALLVPDHLLVMATYEHIGTFSMLTSNL